MNIPDKYLLKHLDFWGDLLYNASVIYKTSSVRRIIVNGQLLSEH